MAAAPQLFYQSPASLFAQTPNADGGGSWLDTTFGNVAKANGVIDDSTFIYFNPASVGVVYEADYGLTLPPAQIGINKITLYIRAWCRSQNNVTVDHTLVASVKPAGGTRYDSAGQTVTGTKNSGGDNPITFVFPPWTTNPATALAWTLTDLVALKVGARATVLTDPTGSSTPYLKISSILVEIEGVPISAFVESVRGQASAWLRMIRRRFRTGVVVGHPRLLNNDLFQPIWIENQLYPTPDGKGTWRAGGTPAWLRRAVIVTGQKIQPDRPLETEYSFVDLREAACTFWSPLRTDIALTDSMDGIAKYDQRGEWSCKRSKVVYVERPVDRFLRSWAADALPFTADGLWLGVTPRNVLLNSSFSQGATNLFTNWVIFNSGTGLVTSDLNDWIYDVTGLRRSVKITNGTTAGTDYGQVSQSFTANNLYQRLKIRYKNDTGGRMGFIFRDITANLDWNDTTKAWVAITLWNFMPVSLVSASYTSNPITNVNASHVFTLYIGYMDVSNAVGHIYQAGWSYIPATPAFLENLAAHIDTVTTTANELVSVHSQVYVGNDIGTRTWFPDKGTALVKVRPAWNHSDINLQNPPPTLIIVAHTDAVDLDWIYYWPVGAAAFLRFRRTRNSSNYEASGSITPWVRDQVYSVAVRWTSSAGELGLPIRTHSIFLAGVLVASATIPTDMPANPGPWQAGVIAPRIYLGETTDGINYPLNGTMSDLEILPFCLTDEEIAKRSA